MNPGNIGNFMMNLMFKGLNFTGVGSVIAHLNDTVND